MRAEKKGYLPLILCFCPRMIHLPYLCSVLWKKTAEAQRQSLQVPPLPPPRLHLKPITRTGARSALQKILTKRCHILDQKGLYFRGRPSEQSLLKESPQMLNLGSNIKLSLPSPPSCHISIVQTENKKLLCLEISQIKASEPYSRDKGRVEAFPHHGEESEKEEEVVWGLASNPIQHSEFLNTNPKEGIHWINVASLPSEEITQGTGSTVIRSNALSVCCCK